MEKIIIKNLKLFAYHGMNPEEKRDGQDFFIDLICYGNLSRACASDKLEDTINYAKVVKCIRRVFTAESYDLIERAAQVVCDAVLEEFEQIQRVDITLKKPHAPVSAEFDYMAVEFSRAR